MLACTSGEPGLGNNDVLASKLSKLLGADLCIMLTTVDGLRERVRSGKSRRVRYLESITDHTYSLVSEDGCQISTGGMAAKLAAAHEAAKAGCAAIIANGRQIGILSRVMNGEDAGTLILAHST